MNIGIDIDDTVSNSFEIMFADAQRFDIEELGNDGKVENYGNINNHNQIETLYSNWTDEEIDRFWSKYFVKVLTDARPKIYSAEIIRKLKEEGNNIYFITSRHEEIKGKTIIEDYSRKWLEKNNFVFDKIIMNAQNKLEASKNANIDLFIDDSYEHCKKVQKGGIKALLFTSCCNQSIENVCVERVYSWIQVYKKYQELKNK